MIKNATVAMVADAAARALENGHDLRDYTPHKAAYDLMSYDFDFVDADYTSLVAAVREWQRSQ
jgi:hypothetical protein